MRLDQATFAFGYTIKSSAGNPNWGTSLGQGKEHKINSFADAEELLKGMVYSSVPLDRIGLKIGKGGTFHKGTDPSAGLVVGSVFNKVFVNHELVEDCSMVLVINRDTSKSHLGRLRLKYSPSISFTRDNGEQIDNEDGLSKIRKKLGISKSACWFIHALNIVNQNELHLSVVVVNNEHTVEYDTTADLHAAWNALIDKPEEESLSKSNDHAKLSDRVVANVDRLTIALKVFAEKRYETEWQDKTRIDGYRNIYDMAAMTPEQIAAGSLDDFYNDFLLKIWAFKNGGSRRYGQLDEAGRKAYRQFVVDLKTQLKSFDAYFPPDPKCPDGMGVGVLTELMMRFWPKSCCNYNASLIHEALVTLHMAEGDFVWPKTPSVYQDFMGKCATILLKMEQMKLPRRSDPGNDEPPDYITVNEFLWFVREYKDLIQEEVMKKQWKPVNSKEKIKSGTRKLSDAFASDAMLKRLAAALRTKPFAILAGHSGTGKSQLVRRLAYMTCNNELLVKEGEGKTAPGNYCMVQVKPNWHDSTDLIGYYSEMGGRHFVNTPFVEFICKAYAYPDTPFFVCLDEMNLAPVEQYFAEYLSAIESMEKKGGEWVTDPLVEVDKAGEKEANGKEKVNPEIVDQIMQGAASTEAATWIQSHGLTIPKNLFVVGTVNMDETTCQFSRKVLDRAMTLLMNDVKFADMANSKKPSEEELLDDDGLKFFLEGEERGKVGETESKLLDGINEPLNNTAFVVAYRFANEYALYESAWAKLNGVDWDAASDEDKTKFAATALDHVVLMKLLPRIHGEAKTVKGIFAGRKADGKDVPGLKSKLPSGGLSVEMMDKILARDDEYLTFWP